MQCPPDNSPAVDQSSFWSAGNLHWDSHRIGWAIAGACTVVTLILSAISVLSHCRNYTNPMHQRQIIRILYMPPVYAVISFLSYRFFRDYTYYSLIEVVYEAITLSAFLLLLIEFVAEKSGKDDMLKKKDKRKLLFPLCCWRYRPTKPYFMYAVKWAVLQYVIVRPLISIIGIICQALNILCESAGFNPHFANVYLESIDFVTISVALYGLLLFYALTREELAGKRPLAKFLSIKLIVFFTFYQSFVFDALETRVIKATAFWTKTNITDGLNALAICIEMIFFSAFMMWAYPYKEYKRLAGTKATGIWKPLWDSINYSDFAVEIVGSSMYFLNRKKYDAAIRAHEQSALPRRSTYSSAFNMDGHSQQRISSFDDQYIESEGIPLSPTHASYPYGQEPLRSEHGAVLPRHLTQQSDIPNIRV